MWWGKFKQAEKALHLQCSGWSPTRTCFGSPRRYHQSANSVFCICLRMLSIFFGQRCWWAAADMCWPEGSLLQHTYVFVCIFCIFLRMFVFVCICVWIVVCIFVARPVDELRQTCAGLRVAFYSTFKCFSVFSAFFCVCSYLCVFVSVNLSMFFLELEFGISLQVRPTA